MKTIVRIIVLVYLCSLISCSCSSFDADKYRSDQRKQRIFLEQEVKELEHSAH